MHKLLDFGRRQMMSEGTCTFKRLPQVVRPIFAPTAWDKKAQVLRLPEFFIVGPRLLIAAPVKI